MKSKRIAIVACGDISGGLTKEIRSFDTIIGVDRAAYTLLTQNIIPAMAIGDFDTATKKELVKIKKCISVVKTYPTQKDQTDLELAVGETLLLQPQSVGIFGATGGRLDHMLSAVGLLERYPQGIRAEIIDQTNRIQMLNGHMEIAKDASYPYVSILPVHSYAVLTLEGFRYPLKRHRLKLGSSLGVSNELNESLGHITVHQGVVLVIRSRDR